MNKPAKSYIRRGLEVESIQARVPSELKAEAEEAAERLKTSMNRFIEAALRWYLDQLKKEKSL